MGLYFADERNQNRAWRFGLFLRYEDYCAGQLKVSGLPVSEGVRRPIDIILMLFEKIPSLLLYSLRSRSFPD